MGDFCNIWVFIWFCHIFVLYWFCTCSSSASLVCIWFIDFSLIWLSCAPVINFVDWFVCEFKLCFFRLVVCSLHVLFKWRVFCFEYFVINITTAATRVFSLLLQPSVTVEKDMKWYWSILYGIFNFTSSFPLFLHLNYSHNLMHT